MFIIFYMPGISYINLYFRAPRPLKPLKSSPRCQNLPGDPFIAQSGHRKPLSARSGPLAFHFSTSVSLILLSWVLYNLILTSQIDRKSNKTDPICLIYIFLSQFKCPVMKKQGLSCCCLFFCLFLLFFFSFFF